MGCEQSVGIHWGTFTTEENARQTRREVGEGCEESGVVEGWGGRGFATCDIGIWQEIAV